MATFVAQRRLKTVSRANEVTWYEPGDVIPDFEDWDTQARRSHLSMEWVTEQPVLPVGGQEFEEKKPLQGVFKCPRCPEKEFSSERAFKIHVTVVHGS